MFLGKVDLIFFFLKLGKVDLVTLSFVVIDSLESFLILVGMKRLDLDICKIRILYSYLRNYVHFKYCN